MKGRWLVFDVVFPGFVSKNDGVKVTRYPNLTPPPRPFSQSLQENPRVVLSNMMYFPSLFIAQHRHAL
jgi:hypothetical protein